MEIEIRTAAISDTISLSDRLRESDTREVLASSGKAPSIALLHSLLASDPDMVWTAYLDGTPEIIWGVAPISPDVGGVWLLGSDRIYDIPRRFMLESVRYVQRMHERYEALTNFVDYRNTPSLIWLEKLGFVPIDVDLKFGFQQRPFIQYASYRNV